MNIMLYVDVFDNIIYYLDWDEYYNICEFLKIQLKLNIYFKNKKLIPSIDKVCMKPKEYLSVIKYVYKLPTIKLNFDSARYYMFMNGHLNIIKFFHTNKTKYRDLHICQAIRYDRLNIIIFLRKNGIEFTLKCMLCAIKCENIDILKYLHKNGIKFTLKCIEVAYKKGNKNILQYIRKNSEINFIKKQVKKGVGRY